MPGKTHHKKIPQEKRYVKKEMAQKRKLAKANEDDMEQDFKISKLEKKVSSLIQNSRAWMYQNISLVFQTIQGYTPGELIEPTSYYFLTPLTQTASLGTAAAGPGEYVNDRFTVKSMNLKGQIQLSIAQNQNALAVPNVQVRLMVVCINVPAADPNANAMSTSLALQDLFQTNNTNQDGTTVGRIAIFSPYNANNRGNVTYYYDKLYSLYPTLESAADPCAQGIASVNFNIKVIPTKKNSIVTSNGNPALGPLTPAYVQRNAWYLVVMSDQNNTADETNRPTLESTVMLHYEF